MTPFAAFGSAFLLIFLAEFGDKTQLALVAVSRPGKRVQVWLGASAAFVIPSGLAVAVGGLVGGWLDEALVAGISGLVFLALGIRALMSPGRDGPLPRGINAWGTFGLVFLTELGDKSQLGTAALAATGGSALAYGAGAALALSLNAALAVAAGAWIASRISTTGMQRLTAFVFLAIGTVMLIWAATLFL